MILKIGGVDFTRCVIVGSHTINDVDIPTYTWTDGSGRTRKSGIKVKAMGSVDLHMRDDTYLQQFRDVMKNMKDEGGCYEVTTFINNTGEDRTFRAFLSATPAEDFIGHRKTLADFSVTIKES